MCSPKASLKHQRAHLLLDVAKIQQQCQSPELQFEGNLNKSYKVYYSGYFYVAICKRHISSSMNYHCTLYIPIHGNPRER